MVGGIASLADEIRRAGGITERALQAPCRVQCGQRVVWSESSASITAAEMTMRPRKCSAGSSFVFTHSYAVVREIPSIAAASSTLYVRRVADSSL